MAQIRKMDCQTEIKSQPDQFYHAFKSNIQQMPKICGHIIQDVKLVQGDWASAGSVRHWHYAVDGNTLVYKETLGAVDDKNRTLVFKAMEDTSLLDSYKSFTDSMSVTPKGEGSLVTWTMEYEKQNDSVPEPLDHIDFYTAWVKAFDAYLLNSPN